MQLLTPPQGGSVVFDFDSPNRRWPLIVATVHVASLPYQFIALALESGLLGGECCQARFDFQ